MRPIWDEEEREREEVGGRWRPIWDEEEREEVEREVEKQKVVRHELPIWALAQVFVPFCQSQSSLCLLPSAP